MTGRTVGSRLPAGFVIAAIIFVLNLPFLAKPIHIDDVYFLEVARNIRMHPLNPFHGQVALMDQDLRIFSEEGRAPSTFEGMSHPPLVPYYLALFPSGANEIFLHIAFFVFTFLASIAAYGLAKRFTASPFLTSLVILCSPVFVVNSQNLMTDVPMLALFLSALYHFIRGMDEESRSRLVLAGILAGMAFLTRYVALILVPLFLVYSFAHGYRLRKTIPALASFVLPTGVWFLQNLIEHQNLHIIASTAHYAKFYRQGSFGLPDILIKATSDIAGLGLAAIGALLIVLTGAGWRRPGVYLLLSFALALPLQFLLPDYNFLHAILLSIFLIGGLLLFFQSVRNADPDQRSGRSGDTYFLMAWMWIAFLSAVFCLPFGTSRYMLPVLPPLVFLVMKTFGAKGRYRATAVLSITVALSFLLSLADYRFARSYRDFTKSLAQKEPSSKIWYIGEWGFRYYMDRNGYGYLLSNNGMPERGDLVVRAELAGLHWMPEEVAVRTQKIRDVDVRDPFPVRILNPAAKAGFYSHGFGLLPFSISSPPLERFTIYRVVR